MPNRPIAPLRYDYRGLFQPKHGIEESWFKELAPKLEVARKEVANIDPELYASGKIPSEKQPLDSAFYLMPERLLAEYRKDSQGSELGRILKVAQRMRDMVDRVVVLGIGGSYMGARALMESCREPYFNELSRAERGSRPRMYFEGNNIDNDASHGLMSLLGRGKVATSVDDRWGIVVISKSGGTLETAVAFRQYLALLKQSLGSEASKLKDFVVPVTGTSGKLFNLAKAIGCEELFPVPDGVGGRFSILSAVGLVPAAVLGLDVVRLLEGAAAMNEQFRTAKLGENPALDYAGLSLLMESKRGATIRVLQAWSKSLESVGLWYDQLLAESLGKREIGATPLTVVNTRDLHSRAQQHQEGRRDKVYTNLIVENWRHEGLVVGQSDLNQDGLNDIATKALPELMTAAIRGTNMAYAEDGRPTADLFLPYVDEATVGQLFQMLMIATVVEGRLLGINPYGQPGVEKYKQNMAKLLGRA